MYSYENLKRENGVQVCQIFSEPIKVLEFFNINDLFAFLLVVFLFGVLAPSGIGLLVGCSLTAVLIPLIRSRYERGILFHWPYEIVGMSLPGLMNPKSVAELSD